MIVKVFLFLLYCKFYCIIIYIERYIYNIITIVYHSIHACLFFNVVVLYVICIGMCFVYHSPTSVLSFSVNFCNK